MQEWQRKALELLPEMQDEILESENPMQLWIELSLCFDEAYEEPKNESFIRRVYDYENWCLTQDAQTAKRDVTERAENHLPTCVAVAFWEHIPTNKAAREDMPCWFSVEDVLASQDIFGYFLTDENFRDLIDMYSKNTLKLVR